MSKVKIHLFGNYSDKLKKLRKLNARTVNK